MTIIEDEQIIAALCNLKGWTKFTTTFVDSIYKQAARALVSKQIVWKSHTDVAQLVKRFPDYFKFETDHLECIQPNEKVFLAFLASIPSDQQQAIAAVLGVICSV